MTKLLQELARAKAEFQLRAVLAAMQAPRIEVAHSAPGAALVGPRNDVQDVVTLVNREAGE